MRRFISMLMVALVVAAVTAVPAFAGGNDAGGGNVQCELNAGTNQEQILLAWDKQNQAAGLKPVTIDYYESYNDAVLALQSGRLDTYFGPNAIATYSAATSPDDVAVAGTVNGGWPDTANIAVATAKGNGLAEAFTAALNHAIGDGTYRKVLDRWGLGAEAI